jgi:hypothetical protein
MSKKKLMYANLLNEVEREIPLTQNAEKLKNATLETQLKAKNFAENPQEETAKQLVEAVKNDSLLPVEDKRALLRDQVLLQYVSNIQEIFKIDNNLSYEQAVADIKALDWLSFKVQSVPFRIKAHRLYLLNKNALYKVYYKTFEACVESEFGLSKSSAYNYIAIHENYIENEQNLMAKVNVQSIGDIEYSLLVPTISLIKKQKSEEKKQELLRYFYLEAHEKSQREMKVLVEQKKQELHGKAKKSSKKIVSPYARVIKLIEGLEKEDLKSVVQYAASLLEKKQG